MKIVIDIPDEEIMSEEVTLIKKCIEASAEGRLHVFDDFGNAITPDAEDDKPSYNSIKTKLEPCDDCVSREYILSKARGGDWNGGGFSKEYVYIEDIENAPSVTPVEKMKHCKDCKYFEYDSVAKVDGIPLIVAHEICKRWSDGCKTSEDGYCFLFEPQEGSDGE